MVVIGPTGRKLGTYVLETDATVLIDKLRSIAGDKYMCMEEGTQSEWLYEVLEPHVKRLSVIQPLKREGNKSDSIDALRLADMMRRDALERTIFKSPKTMTGLRQAARGYIAIRRDVVRAKARLKALFRSRGIRPESKTDLYDPETRQAWLDKLPPSHRRLGELLGAELDALAQPYETAQNWLLEEAKKEPITHRLATAPGIGEIRAALLTAIVVSPKRFRTKRQFWSYCGLSIVTRSSSDHVRENGRWVRKPVAQTRGLNRNRQPELKAIFKGAAMTVLGMPNHPLCQNYQRMTEQEKIKPNLAKLTLARRIAAATWSMWKHKEDYDPSRHKAPTPSSQ
jgi:transposase